VEVYHQDHLGSVRELTDSQGHVTSIYLTDEYGVPSTLEGPDGTPASASDQPFWYTGEQWDSETGFTYLRARYYASSVGRFTSRDVLAGVRTVPGSLNRYACAGNNPVNWTDPSGMIAPAIAAGAVLGTVVGAYGGFMGALAQGGNPTQMVVSAAMGVLWAASLEHRLP
jgi:RHS repeat-associated protein